MRAEKISRYIARAREAGGATSLRIVLSRLSGYLRYGPDAVARVRLRYAPPPLFDRSAQRRLGVALPAPCVLWDEAALQVLGSYMARGGEGDGIGQAALKRADKLLKGELEVLGWGQIPCAMPPPWHTDCYRDATWPVVFHKFVDTVRAEESCDVKVPWELSRLQFLSSLGQAWVASREPAYIASFWNILRDWSIRNPVGYGVNWTCSMEVAIRAINIAVAANLFGAVFTRAEADWLHKLLKSHYNHIRFNLEFSDVKGNHYFFDQLGLAVLATVLFGPNSHIAGSRVARYLEEAVRQFHPDGVHIENATGYHRLMTEGLVFFALFCRRQAIALPDRYARLIATAARFLQSVHVGDGSIPLIGDSDSGNILILSNTQGNEVRPLLQLCSVAFGCAGDGDPEPLYEETAWLVASPDAFLLGSTQRRHDVHRTESTSTMRRYPDGGYYVVRDSGTVVVVRCGGSGLGGRGSHDHNDQLSVFLSVFGKPLIIDPGTNNYTADRVEHARDLATGRHSTVSVNSLEQAPIGLGSVTSSVRSARGICTSFSMLVGAGYCWEGVIENYHAPGCGLSHVRKVEVEELSPELALFTITDAINSRHGGALDCVAAFPIHPSWEVTESFAQGLRLSNGAATVIISVASCATACHLVPDRMAPEYGTAVPMTLVRISFSGRGTACLVTRLRCQRSTSPQVVLTESEAAPTGTPKVRLWNNIS